MGWLFVAAVALSGGALFWLAGRRVRRLSPLPEAVPSCAITDLSRGRFRLVGHIVPVVVTPSAIDGADCVFIERVEYETVGSQLLPVLREIDRWIFEHPFYIDDGTGSLLVDPRLLAVEATVLTEDEGLLAERRLRAGEEVEMVATFRPREGDGDGGPYRANARAWEPASDVCGPPRISYRTVAGMVATVDEMSSFMRGIGAVLLLTSLVGAAIALI